ncbi:expressed unknown protein [Seminavis robusta]|uniref:BTB domain-containing protein n=1 Tax=Seminavis robusta TaxID=568900 RepID=A0A9N8EJK9_9STRA|nr:expressed unknown protein [Seminavis robusta]|eukprot:Sro1036_g234080.1 n/a (341) ;mRNA; r:29398-30420
MATNNDKGIAKDAEPLFKNIRSSDPDVKILVKYEDGEGKLATKEYQMYGQHISQLSKFIDTSLSVEMKEKSTKEIIFQDVQPELFEKAIKFHQDLCAIRSITPKDALSLVEFYDKYEFQRGLNLCDDVLVSYIEEQNALDMMTPPHDLDLLVEAASLAFQCNLTRTKDMALSYLGSRFKDLESMYGRIMFDSGHLNKLHQLFVDGQFDDCLPHDMTKEEVASPLFPKYFATHTAAVYGGSTCTAVDLSGTGTALDGRYSRHNNDFRKGRVIWNARFCEVLFEKETNTGDWAIVTEGQAGSRLVLFTCPHSNIFGFPPAGPWMDVDASAPKNVQPRVTHRS